MAEKFNGRTAKEWEALYWREKRRADKLEKMYLAHSEKNHEITYRSRAKVLEKMRKDPSDRRHGTNYGYTCGCHCDKCRAAHAENVRRYRSER